MDEERCPNCGSIAYPDESTCDECGASLSGRARPSRCERQSRARTNLRGSLRVLLLSSFVILVLFRDRVIGLLAIPWMAPLVAAAILVVGLPWAWKSLRPRISYVVVIGSALVFVCLWLRPAFIGPWIPSTLPLLLLLLIGFVLPEAPTFRDPQSFRIGLVMIAVPIGSVWPLHAWINRLELGFREYNIVLHGVALLFAVAMFIGGLWFLSEANKSSG